MYENFSIYGTINITRQRNFHYARALARVGQGEGSFVSFREVKTIQNTVYRCLMIQLTAKQAS